VVRAHPTVQKSIRVRFWNGTSQGRSNLEAQHEFLGKQTKAIDPITLTITFDESVRHAGYSAYHGKRRQGCA
jgi:hypothetical protein